MSISAATVSPVMNNASEVCLMRNLLLWEDMVMSEYIISMTWDSNAAVWCAVNDEIPIALESGSFDALVERIKAAVPELLIMNGAEPECILHFVAERRDGVA